MINQYESLIPNCIDKYSIEGKWIKGYMLEMGSKENSSILIEVPLPENSYTYASKLFSNDKIREFNSKYCLGPKAIKDDIYYFINAKRNNYEFLTVQRDLEKSPRKESKPKLIKPYVATYDGIEKDPEMIANYYSKKYSISDKENIVAIMTEDDVLCLNCGCISDQRLSDVPDIKTHITNMACPKCGSTTSPLVTFNKYLHRTSMHCRDAEK